MLSHPRAAWVLLAALTLAHWIWLASFVRTAYSAPDADGYYAHARMLVLEGHPDFEPEAPVQHLGMHWLEKQDGRFVSRYPPGLSIVVGAVWKLFGRDASLYVNAVLAALTLPLVFLLCRPYAGDWLALAGALIQAASPAANFHALSGDSHTLTTFCLVGGLVLLDRWGRRGGRWLAFGAGFMLAYIPLVRFAEAAAAIGIIAFLILIWRKPERRAEITVVIGGALLPALALAAHNQYHFGAVWRTAYALTGESNLSLAYLLRNWGVYGQSLLTSGVGYFVAPAVVGLVLMLRDQEARPLAAALGLIAGGITLLYCCYYFAEFGSPVTIRFLLPTLPLYLPPAFYLFRILLPPPILLPAVTALVVLQISIGQPAGALELRRQAASADRSAAAIRGIDELVPDGAVVFGDRRLNEQLHFTGQWKLADADLLLEPSQRGRRPGPGGLSPPPGGANRPSPRQRGKGAQLRARYQRLSGTEKARAALEDSKAWAGSEGVYLALSERDRERLPELPPGCGFELAGRIELPGEPQDERRLGPQRRGPPGRPGPPAGGGGAGSEFGLSGDPILIYRIVDSGP